MAKVNANGTPTKGRIGGWSYYISSLYGILARIATNLVPKDRKSTEAQRLVQLALANWIIFWRNFARMLRPTFENRERGESEVNKFVSVNYKDYAVFLPKGMVEHGACVAVPACINEGTLVPSINYWKDSAADWMVSDLLLGDLVIDQDTTVGQFAQALFANNFNGTTPIFTDGKSYLDFFKVEQRIDLNTRYPMVTVSGRHLLLDSHNTDKLWATVGGSEGYQSYKGHLATPFATLNLYAWIHMHESTDRRGKYIGTTQSLMGDNTAMIQQYTSEEAFELAAESYGGYDKSFLIPFKAKLNTFQYTLPTEETLPGQNPAGSGISGSGSQGGSGSQSGSGSQGGGDTGGGSIDM